METKGQGKAARQLGKVAAGGRLGAGAVVCWFSLFGIHREDMCKPVCRERKRVTAGQVNEGESESKSGNETERDRERDRERH